MTPAKYLLLLAALTGATFMILASENPAPIAIAIHGGAGTLTREEFTPEKEQQVREVLEQAVRAGHAVLAGGGTSADAVTRAVTLLEDSPWFNAGRGAVFNAEGKVELDASIMDGATLDAGAVAAVRNVRNPVVLAREVMDASPHVMLMGEGAESFARERGIVFEDDAWFHTEHRWQQLMKARANPDPAASYLSETPDQWFSTVGAVALDSHGNVAAATSTGGMTNKQWGRVGDSPIIGAGTYADNRSCAVSATGHGEFFIRASVARSICARVEMQDRALDDAAEEVVMGQLVEMGGRGGIIAVDRNGRIALTFNTPGMYRASISPDGDVHVAIFKDE